MKPNISAVTLARNEQDRIEKCLKSLSWVSECIVVDNGSTDNTIALAKKYQAKVIINTSFDFSLLRNLGKDAASGDWILYVDADEEVTPQLRKRLESIVSIPLSNQDPIGYFITRRNYYLGHLWPVQDKMQRFFWKKSLERWEGKLHETAIVDGRLSVIKEPLLHDTHRTLEEMVAKTNQWSEIEAKLRLNAGHPLVVWWRLIRVMITAFWNSFVTQQGWRAGTVGWIEGIYQAFSIFITYAKLWELQQRDQK